MDKHIVFMLQIQEQGVISQCHLRFNDLLLQKVLRLQCLQPCFVCLFAPVMYAMVVSAHASAGFAPIQARSATLNIHLLAVHLCLNILIL